MPVFSSDLVVILLSGVCLGFGVRSILMGVFDKRSSPSPAFMYASACGAFALACVIQFIATKSPPWVVGGAGFSVLTLIFLALTSRRYKKWGKA